MRNRLIVVAIALCVLFGGAVACAPASNAATGTVAAFAQSPTCRGTSSFWSPAIFWGIWGWNCSVRWW